MTVRKAKRGARRTPRSRASTYTQVGRRIQRKTKDSAAAAPARPPRISNRSSCAVVLALGSRPLQVEAAEGDAVRRLEGGREHEAPVGVAAVPAEPLEDVGRLLGVAAEDAREDQVFTLVEVPEEEGLPVEEDALLEPRGDLAVVHRVEPAERLLRHAEEELAVRPHGPDLHRPARPLLEVARLDLPDEGRVHRQLRDPLGQLARGTCASARRPAPARASGRTPIVRGRSAGARGPPRPSGGRPRGPSRPRAPCA